MPIERTPLTITELVSGIKDLIEPEFDNVWVVGEISSLNRHSNGHIYLTLTDEKKSSLSATIWRSIAIRLKHDFQIGMQVLAHGKIDLWMQSGGKLSFHIDTIEPRGIGAAELALQQLKEKLFQKGYFDRERKRPLPRFPKRIGIVSSATGAALRDILELFAKRWPMADIVVRNSAVQGAGAGKEIAAAVNELSALHRSGLLSFDAIIVGRGGGSREDLASFNEEVVADAIVQAAMPIVSAVGHEIDVSISDLVADVRAETPSHAVSLLVPDRREVSSSFLDLVQRTQSLMATRFRNVRERLDRIKDRPPFRSPLDRIREREQRIDDGLTRLARAANVRIGRTKEQLAALAGRLDGLSPLKVLTRGYSLTMKDGRIVRDAERVTVGDQLVTRLAKGEIVSAVIQPRNI